MWGKRGQRNKVTKYGEGPLRVHRPWAPSILATPLYRWTHTGTSNLAYVGETRNVFIKQVKRHDVLTFPKHFNNMFQNSGNKIWLQEIKSSKWNSKGSKLNTQTKQLCILWGILLWFVYGRGDVWADVMSAYGDRYNSVLHIGLLPT